MHKFDRAAATLTQYLGSRVTEHVSLGDVTEFGIGGMADFFFEAVTPADLMAATRAASAAEIPWLVIGTASQTAFSDFGFAGLVIRNQSRSLEQIPGTSQLVLDSGVAWPIVVSYAASHLLGGIEPYTLFSGTVGGSLAARRELPGIRLSSIVRHVTVAAPGGEPKRIPLAQLRSALKRGGIILTVTLQLVQARHDEIIRRLAVFERRRRRYVRSDIRWLGPIFRFADAHQDWDELFRARRVAGLRSGGAVFSAERPNFIAARGRVRGRDIGQLVTQAHEILSAHLPTVPAVALRFVGSWEDDGSA